MINKFNREYETLSRWMVYEELIFKQKIEYSVNTIYIFKYVNITIIKEHASKLIRI